MRSFGAGGSVFRQFWPHIFTFLLISALSLYLITLGSQLQVALRGAALAEGNWTRLFNESLFHLDRYAAHGADEDLERYRARMAVIDAHSRIRDLLREGEVRDYAAAAELLDGAGHDPADLPLVMRLLQRHRDTRHLRAAFDRGEDSDGPVLAVQALAERIEAARAAGDTAAAAEARAGLLEHRDTLAPMREDITHALGDASRRIRATITALSVVAVGSLGVLALFLIAHAMRRFAESEQRFRHLLNTANDGVIAVDPRKGTILGGNAKVSELTGRGEAHLVGRLYRDLFPEDERGILTDAHGRVRDGMHQLHLLHRDGRRTPVEAGGSYTLWDDEEALLVIFRDVTERRAHQRRIEYLASHDALTGLTNRREFETIAEDLLTERRGRGHAMLYLDLDQFKVVNDTCGHAAGDELLRQLTARLRRGIRDTDTLARLGGDEFGVLLVDCSLLQAEQIAVKLVSCVNDWRFAWGGKHFAIGASIGVVALEGGGPALAALMSAADAACYAAKEAGRNRVVVYRPGDSALTARQDEMHWVSRLTDALDRAGIGYGQRPRRKRTGRAALRGPREHRGGRSPGYDRSRRHVPARGPRESDPTWAERNARRLATGPRLRNARPHAHARPGVHRQPPDDRAGAGARCARRYGHHRPGRTNKGPVLGRRGERR
jgi:diguanylate cyclase (GGDEF)-like protein/PAS domain S-box-containing protein